MMNRNYVFFILIGLGAVCVTVALCRAFGLGVSEPETEPPEVLMRRIQEASSEEEQFDAARDLARYGRQARAEIHRAIASSDERPARVQKQLYQD